ncbi:MAG TPA: phenylacetate--CoA ligase [bacterium]|nr:phenylacetate--CoA ligase [bacterium]
MEQGELAQLQLERLQATIHRVSRNVTFYRRLFEKHGMDPDGIKDLSDLSALPFTTKQDLRDNYPYGMFAVPMRDVVRVHSSSGTTGKPTVVGYTRNDLDNWADLMARVHTMAGISKDDILQIAFAYGLFTGAFGHHYGAEKIGATVIPMSSGNTRKQIMIMQDYKSTALICTPSYALYLAESMAEMGAEPKGLALRWGLFGAEAWSERMRRELEEKLPIVATDNYGLSEVMGPGVAGECLHKDGLHLFEDSFIYEIIDPATQKPVPEGAKGELVVTTINKEAFPLLRYRTRDVTRFLPGRCKCGRTGRRIEKVMGRNDDMIIVRGVNLFPSQIEDLLMKVEGVAPHYQIIVDRVNNLDTLEIQIEVNEKMMSDEVQKLQSLQEFIAKEIKDLYQVGAKVKLVEPRTIQRFEGKAVRVVDKRRI